MAHIGNHGTGDHEYFISGRGSKLPSDPDYVPLVYSQKKTDNDDNDTGSSQGLSAVAQFEKAQCLYMKWPQSNKGYKSRKRKHS